MSENYWGWLLSNIRGLFTIRHASNPWVEYIFGVAFGVSGTMVSVAFYTFWLIPIFIVGGILLGTHGYWRIEARRGKEE